MFSYAISKLKTRKYILQGVIFFSIFLFIYLILDFLNYRETINKPSNIWIITNIVINLIMSLLSMLLMNLSTVMLETNLSGDKSSNLGFISIIFGIFTYGCTSCVITFIAAIGITFSPTIFPFITVWYGIVYKLISLLLLVVGLVIISRKIKYGRCRVKY